MSMMRATTSPALEHGAAGHDLRRMTNPVKVSPIEQTLLQRAPGCACGGGCPRCRSGSSSRYTINAPGDQYEQEADRIADHVMRMPDPDAPPAIAPAVAPAVGAGAVQRACAACGGPVQERYDEESELIQGKGEGSMSSVDDELGSRIDAVRGKGEPLAAPLRSYFEPRLGHDLSRVRIHTDADAAETARAVRAQAYTIGGDIVFGAGRYAPETETGRRLLAHELVHTIQQGASRPVGGGSTGGPTGGPAGDGARRGGLQRGEAPGIGRAGIQRVPAERIQRADDATFEAGSGVGPAITAGTMRTDSAIHGQTVTATNCFGREGCNIRFRFAKAYTGDYNYVGGGGTAVRGVYVKIVVRYDADSCGPCHRVDLLQVVRNTTRTGGNIVTAEPDNAVRRERSGWGDPNARSRGWRVDTLTTLTNPYYTATPSFDSQVGSATRPAILWDAPGDWTTDRNMGKEFETCAICRPRSGAAASLACVRWGYFIDGTGAVAFRPAVPIAICGVTQHLNDATLRWGRIAGNTPANIDFRREPPPPEE